MLTMKSSTASDVADGPSVQPLRSSSTETRMNAVRLFAIGERMVADHAFRERGGLAPDAAVVSIAGATDRREQGIGVDDAWEPAERQRLLMSVEGVCERDAIVTSSYRLASRLSASE